MNLPARRRVRVRSVAVVVGVSQTPTAEPVPEAKADKVLIALHHRPEMPTEDLAVMLATMPLTVLSVLRSMAGSGLLDSAPSGPGKGASLVWKLTTHGAKQAVFAIHRDRKARPRSTFVGGINPWTGAKMRK